MKYILWAIFLIAASTNLPAPLFPYYQTAYHLSDFAVTVLFAAYAGCLLPTLLVSSAFASRNGLRRTSALGLLLALCSALLFAGASSAWQLYAARIIEGIAVGAFMGTANALLLRHSAQGVGKSLKYSSMCNMFGFGFGPLACGLLLQYSNFLTHRLPYLLLAAALASALALFYRLEKKPETLDKKAPLRVCLGVPEKNRRLFWGFIAPSAFVMLALNGIVISLFPTYMKVLFHTDNPAFTGSLLFLMLSGSGAAQLITRPAEKIRRVRFGICFLILGTWFMITAAPWQSAACLWIGMILQAAGTGWTFQGALQLTGECSDAKNRGGAISAFFVCAYSGMALPTIGIGLLSTLHGLMDALLIFGVCLTLAGLAIVLLPHGSKESSPALSAPAQKNP